jgi:putative hydrolase of HD superfamily
MAGQLAFLREVDKVKQIFRLTYLLDASRRENDAEHSWELALMAMVLSQYAPQGLDVSRVIRMVLLHDVVEIDPGDVSVYDLQARKDKQAEEQACARRVFGLLPEDQGRDLRALWEEFEARRSPEARFAKALDRLQPLLHNYLTRGKAWQEHGTKLSDVLGVNRETISQGSPPLWAFAESMIRDAVKRGFLADDTPGAQAD